MRFYVGLFRDCTQSRLTKLEELEGEIMSIVPSEVGKVNAQADEETEWGWAVDGLKEVYDHAQREGIRMAIEPLNRFETNFISRHDQALVSRLH